ncbi:hypothetical protein SETIT_2G344800v2 [Setaria italica]|uniref:Uncharacterized protein n=1 Tax=Setaria italica TaxID=4555 RepID=A0A368Q5X1_SETIT|nr:hypothetical protein SETIT_2G344800v2 [Setaria italica]
MKQMTRFFGGARSWSSLLPLAVGRARLHLLTARHEVFVPADLGPLAGGQPLEQPVAGTELAQLGLPLLSLLLLGIRLCLLGIRLGLLAYFSDVDVPLRKCLHKTASAVFAGLKNDIF